MRALVDLVFPVSCAACGEPGASACVACTTALRAPARLRRPTPAPPLLPPPFAVADYSGATRDLVLAYKEREVVALTAVLATALAVAIDAATGTDPTVAVVPVPSTPAALRRRGFDPVGRLTRRARRGRWRPVLPALTHVRAVGDSAGLSAVARQQNLSGALAVAPRLVEQLSGRRVVVVDDVITTGATVAEASRALRAVGADVVAAAVVAATVRKP